MEEERRVRKWNEKVEREIITRKWNGSKERKWSRKVERDWKVREYSK